jgi:hypothetical protein
LLHADTLSIVPGSGLNFSVADGGAQIAANFAYGIPNPLVNLKYVVATVRQVRLAAPCCSLLTPSLVQRHRHRENCCEQAQRAAAGTPHALSVSLSLSLSLCDVHVRVFGNRSHYTTIARQLGATADQKGYPVISCPSVSVVLGKFDTSISSDSTILEYARLAPTF